MVSSLEKAEQLVLHFYEQWLDEWAEHGTNHDAYNEIKHESLLKNTTETAMARISGYAALFAHPGLINVVDIQVVEMHLGWIKRLISVRHFLFLSKTFVLAGVEFNGFQDAFNSNILV